MKKYRLEEITECDLSTLRWGVVGDFPQGDYLGDKLSRFRSTGVKAVIDVRCHSEEEVQELRVNCKRYGLEYLYIPFSSDVKYTQSVNGEFVRLFPRFCQLLEAGGNYLCGHSEATLALMVYWLFCGADKGIWFSRLFKKKRSDYIPFLTFTLIGDFMRTVRGMQEHFTEFGQIPLTKTVFDLRVSKVLRFLGCQPNEWVGKHSFLKVTSCAEYGRYRVSMNEQVLGWIKEPDRTCNDWRYNFVFQGQTFSGEGESFHVVKGRFFDYLYSQMPPEDYLKLMNS